MSMTSLQLPEQTELEDAATAGDQAAVEDAVAAQEPEAVVEGAEPGCLDDLHDPEFVEADGSDDLQFARGLLEEPVDEDTLLEEPADEEGLAADEEPAAEEQSPGPQLAAPPQSPARPITHRQPPKSAALVAYEHRRAEARDRYEGTMFEFRKLEAAAKAAKERWKDAEDALYDVLSERPDEDAEDVESLPMTSAVEEEADVVEVSGESGDSSAPTEAELAPVAEPSNAWRSESILSLNLKTTIADKLIEAGYNTIGKLEDLRADTFAGGLKSIKGIGQAKADAIEEAILNWLSKNRDREVLAAAASASGEAIAETTTEEAVADEPGEFSEAVAPTQAVEEADATLPSIQEKIAARAQAIFFRTGDLSSVSPEDCLSQQLDDARYFEGGWEAYNAGSELTDCPTDPAGVERDDWLRGWMSAKLTNEEGWQGPGSDGKEGSAQ